MRPNFKKKILFGILATLTVLIIIFVILMCRGQQIKIFTSKKEYQGGESLRLSIKNYLLGNICFSSCYPYYLEKKNGIGWKDYAYQDCPHSNLVESCIGPFNAKAFEISLPRIINGAHRVLIPVCNDCEVGSQFRETKRFYSNEFEVR